MNATKLFKNKESYITGLLVLIVVILTIIAVTPSWRTKVQDFFHPEQRQILATATSELPGLGKIKVIKIKNKDGLQLEVYTLNDVEDAQLFTKLDLMDKKDGFFTLMGEATNLAVTDVDHDGVPDIVAPTFDNNMVAHLNIFKYHSEIKSFSLAQPESINQSEQSDTAIAR